MSAQNPATVTEALRRLSPSAGTQEAAYGAAFRRIAELLINGTTLHVAGHRYRFTELEIYFHGFQHLDPFTHGNAIQKQLGAWYFHRSGTRYRSGTYKGLDIAFGNSDAFGGILIRGIADLAAPSAVPGELIDGPCKVVDHILAVTASSSIETLVSRFDTTIEHRTGRLPLHVELDVGPGRAAPIYATPRIGLTLKKANSPVRRRFIARHYRFLSEPARIRKGKSHLITALHQQGYVPTAIAALTDTRLSVLEGYLEAFQAGPATSLEDLRRDLTASETCKLLGACAVEESGNSGDPAQGDPDRK